MIKNLTFITGNKQKAAAVQKYIGFPVEHQALDLVEIQSLMVEEIIEHKAKEAHKILNKPILVQDASLVFISLGKLPGPYIKWFMQEIGNEGLCRIVSGLPSREAVAEVSFGIYDGKTFHQVTHRVSGKISDTPRGGNGFGWDSIFIPDGFNKTYAEMTHDELKKNYILTHSLEKLTIFLKNERYI